MKVLGLLRGCGLLGFLWDASCRVLVRRIELMHKYVNSRYDELLDNLEQDGILRIKIMPEYVNSEWFVRKALI